MKPYLLVGIFKFSSPKALFLSSWKSFQDAYTVLSAELLWLHNRIILFHWGKLAFFISWYFFPLLGASLVVQMVKNLPAMQESWVQSLGRKEPLEKGMATTPVFWPGKYHGQRSLVGCSPWGRKESDMTERMTHTQLAHLKNPNSINKLSGRNQPFLLSNWHTEIWKDHLIAELYALHSRLVQEGRETERGLWAAMSMRDANFCWKREAENRRLHPGDIGRKTHFQSNVREELKARAWGLTAGFQTIGRRCFKANCWLMRLMEERNIHSFNLSCLVFFITLRNQWKSSWKLTTI